VRRIVAPSKVQWHFDLDGTLFFTHYALLKSYEEAISQMGGEFTPLAKSAFMKGENYLEFLKLCQWDVEHPDWGEVRAVKNEIYLSNLDLITPNSELLAIALSLAPNISIVTSSGRLSVEGILKHFGLHGEFTNIVSADDVSRLKPDPDPYLKSISKDPTAVHIAIEDSDYGIQSALKAGLLVLKYDAKFITSFKNLAN
jgi:beta-phosphoglucomutase-like phosphatase (HAD superfamily)